MGDGALPVINTLMEADASISIERVTTEDIISGRLEQGFDVIVVPGGYAPNYEEALGAGGAEAIKSFVEAGGGYVGICAGAYLGCEDWLELLPVVYVHDIEHWWGGERGGSHLPSTTVERWGRVFTPPHAGVSATITTNFCRAGGQPTPPPPRPSHHQPMANQPGRGARPTIAC